MSNTEFKIIEGNKLITEFMGSELLTNGKYYVEGHEYLPDDTVNWMYASNEYELKYMCYDSSWDWLMPVAIKVAEEIVDMTIDPANKICSLDRFKGTLYKPFEEDTLIMAVWTACIEAIKHQLAAYLQWKNGK